MCVSVVKARDAPFDRESHEKIRVHAKTTA
jgi:hypothetical protein